MANWPTSPEWPDLRKLNNGYMFESTSKVNFSEVFNQIVQALIYLYWRED